ncbi:PREDICTED: membrane-associated phosphatidylinositol transfer protein 1-like [Tinamus guttatus]|uniref:membrane-associated phosphatidylinositol transfer protein 1-like n=1 Tax=Tinamus guttatus TaxID=94827 RepID=UPI00052F0B78|nr:PREDICTED: membrane-associated phosphatidylinositol transfer protein 1-like [Tinamus guttatus]
MVASVTRWWAWWLRGERWFLRVLIFLKKSREESSGEGSGVEILANRPYSDGPGGSGQYTHKIYHVGSHIPSWFRALLPKAALQVEEESWNAYPYTRTRYTCPFVEKFSIEIETYYRPDCGQQTNVFNLSAAEKRQRILDTIDIVRDPISPGEYKAEEDPKLYRSAKTTAGGPPLGTVRGVGRVDEMGSWEAL